MIPIVIFLIIDLGGKLAIIYYTHMPIQLQIMNI